MILSLNEEVILVRNSLLVLFLRNIKLVRLVEN